MGPEDNVNPIGDLYLITEDGNKVAITATMFCIPDLIGVDMGKKGDYLDNIAFSLRNPYNASFTIEPTDETVKN